jgi:hypothetical protein
MSFSNYKNIGTVVKEFQITYTEADFIQEIEFAISDYFREDLNLVMREGVVDNSEFAICENLIYPVLKEVWKYYRSDFVLYKFDEGWGQCLAEMVAAQKLNRDLPITVFGIVSNGKVWQFGKLEESSFTKNISFYSIQDLDKLFAVVNYVFRECALQLKQLVTA